jgi:hypothetical protein
MPSLLGDIVIKCPFMPQIRPLLTANPSPFNRKSVPFYRYFLFYFNILKALKGKREKVHKRARMRSPTLRFARPALWAA